MQTAIFADAQTESRRAGVMRGRWGACLAVRTPPAAFYLCYMRRCRLNWAMSRRFDRFNIFECSAAHSTTAFEAPLASRVFDQKPPHGLGRCSKEVTSAIPMLSFLGIHEAQVRFMYKRRRLQRLTGPFLRHLLCRQSPQFVVDERQELLCGSPWKSSSWAIGSRLGSTTTRHARPRTQRAGSAAGRSL
jgi:hypothetical protein